MSSELKLITTSQIIKSNNNEIIFKLRKKKIFMKGKEIKNTSQNNNENIIYTSESTIKIDNISTKYVALRVRTTKKNHYKIEPSYSIIPPKTFVNIKIFYHSNPGEQISSVGHKFKFEGFVIEEKFKNYKNILSLFQHYISNKISVQGNFILKSAKLIQENEIIKDNINYKLIKKIEECEESRNIHKNLMKELYNIRIQNKITIKDYFISGKELIFDIKNNRLYFLSFFAIFLLSTILGIYMFK